MNIWKLKIHIFAKEFLQLTILTYLLLLITETFKEGFVSYFFNIHILLGVIGFLGIIVIATYKKEKQPVRKNKITFGNIFFSFLLAAISGVFIYDRTIMLGSISYAIVTIGVLIILLFSLLFLTDNS